MPGQQEIVDAMLTRIKPNGVHQVDSGLAEILTAIAVNLNKEGKIDLDQRFTQLKEELNKHREDRPINYDTHALPYATHYIPKNYAKVQNTLLELLRKDLPSDKLFIKDIGSGPGTTALAAANFFTHLAEVEKAYGINRQRKVTISSREKYKQNIAMFKWLRDKYYEKNQYAKENIIINDPLEITITQELKIEKRSEESVDIMFMSNILSEMQDDFQKTVEMLSRQIKKDGSFVLIETADVVATNKINRAKYVLRNKGFDVYSPAAIWSPCCEFVDTQKFEQCGWGEYGDCTYCYITKPNMQELQYPGESPAPDMKYNFVIMRKDNISLFPGIPQGYSKLNGISQGRHNIRVFKQREKTGKYAFKEITGRSCQVFFSCDGTCGRDYAQLIPHDYNHISTVLSAREGDRLDLRNVLIQNNTVGYAKKDIILDSATQVQVFPNTL